MEDQTVKGFGTTGIEYREMRPNKLSHEDKQGIIEGYSNLETMEALSKKYGVTRQSIRKTLKTHGVDTSKRLIDVSCNACGKVFGRHKGRIRKQLNHYCCTDCYTAGLEAGNGKGKYKQSRWGQVVARKKVAALYDLKEDHVVHHEDRNCLNNEINNLVVFACQGDHVRHHRGFKVTPLWEG